VDNTAQQKFHFIEIYRYAAIMRLPYHMSDVALLFGDCGTTDEFFLLWLRGAILPRTAHSVLASVCRDTRQELLAQALLDQIGRTPDQRVLSYAEFLEAGGNLGEVVLAVHSSEDGDFGVAFRVGDHGVLVNKSEGTGYFLPTLDLPESVAAPFSLGLAGLCAQHGLKPGRFPEWLAEPVLIGKACLSAEITRPLKIPRQTLHRVQCDQDKVIFATTPEQRNMRQAEAQDLVQHGRTFEKQMSVVSKGPPGKVVFCASGPSAGAIGQLGAWQAFFPELQGHTSILHSTCIWHRFAQGMLEKGGVHPDLQLGHSTGRWAAQTTESATLLLSRLEKSRLEEDLADNDGAIREVYASFNELEAASARGIIWQAWLVLGPIENVQAAIGGSPLVEIIERRGPLECVIAGFPEALDDVMLELLNSPRMHTTQIEFDIALHSSAARRHSAALQLVYGIEGLDLCEDVESGIEAAWEKGGRIFVDLGPRAGYAHWIPKILEGKDYQVVALDPGMHGPAAMIDAFVRLSALGLPVDLRPFECVFETNEFSKFTLPERRRPAEWVQEARRLQTSLFESHLAFLNHEQSAFAAFVQAHQAGLRALEDL
jgi:hypothetical protein